MKNELAKALEKIKDQLGCLGVSMRENEMLYFQAGFNAAYKIWGKPSQPEDEVDRATQGPLSPEVAEEMIDGLDKAFGLK